MAQYDQRYVETYIGKKVAFSKAFESNGEIFSAVVAAEKWARQKGFTVGPMQCEAPMGLAKDAESVGKWFNLGSDAKLLDGAIIGEDKRKGSVTVLLSFNPEA